MTLPICKVLIDRPGPVIGGMSQQFDRCGSTTWTREVQSLTNERQTLSFAGEATAWWDFEEVWSDTVEVVAEWTCDQGHAATDEIHDIIFEEYA